MAMRKCKECDTEISKSAKSCPKCGHVRKNRWFLKFVVLPFVALGVLGNLIGEKETDSGSSAPAAAVPATPAAPPPPPAEITYLGASCSDLAKQFGLKSKLTDLQKDAAWEPYKGAHFKWDLKVVTVDTTFGQLQAQFKCKRSRAFTSDIILSIADSDKGLAIQFEKNGVYTIHGTLQNYGNFLGMSGDLIGAE